MSASRQSFADFLTDLEFRCGLNSDATLGTVTSTLLERTRFARFTTNAMKTCWEKPVGKDWVWPWTVLNNPAVTVGVSGAIDPSTLGDCRWFSVWTADPRPAQNNACFVPCLADGGGLWPQITGYSTFFVFYIPRPPEYSVTPIGATTSFQVDQIAFNNGASGDGECYRALQANVTFADVGNTAKWAVQPVYKNFQSAASQMAEGLWRRANGSYDLGKFLDDEGYEDLSEQYQAAVRDQGNFHPARLWARGSWR